MRRKRLLWQLYPSRLLLTAVSLLAVNCDERVLSMNAAAARRLGVNPERAQGRALAEVVRNSDLLRLVRDALEAREPTEGQVSLVGDEGARLFEGHATVLRDADGRELGAVVALHDVTDERRLGNVRRDFVANVSHELRTPVTAIKGFADPAARERFVGVIGRHAERLSAIIEDLLTLSSVEHGAEDVEVRLCSHSVRSVLSAAIEVCDAKARSRALGGKGLGLAIVKHIMQTRDGRESVESSPGKGSLFRLHLLT